MGKMVEGMVDAVNSQDMSRQDRMDAVWQGISDQQAVERTGAGRTTLAEAPNSRGSESAVARTVRSVFQANGPLRYIDINFSVGRIYGVSAGVILDAEDSSIRFYAGPALAFGAATSFTMSSQGPTQGWNLAIQGSVSGVAYQMGLDPTGRIFTEAGFAYGTGFTISGTWISPKLSTPGAQYPSALQQLFGGGSVEPGAK